MKEKDYWIAAASSFSKHTDQAEIKLGAGIGEIPLGFHPYGINSKPTGDGGDRVAIADYFGPAVCTLEIRVTDEALQFTNVSFVHGAWYGPLRYRVFPPPVPPMDANRCTIALWSFDDMLWVSRGQRELFVLMPSGETPKTTHEQKIGTRWDCSKRIPLPSADNFPSLVSASFIDGNLRTIEADSSYDGWETALYEFNGAKLNTIARSPIRKWSQGVVQCGKEPGKIITVTNGLEKSRDIGVYMDEQLLVPSVSGTGICALSNGGLLISRYGQEEGGPFKGVTGALLYVPPTEVPGLQLVR